MTKHAEYMRKWRAKHPGYATQYIREWRKRNPERNLSILTRYQRGRRAFLDELKNKPCQDCRQKFPPVCMDWDHVRGSKIQSLASLHSCSLARVRVEIAKCDLVCANCHRKRTFNRSKENK
jgi:hypothetical protein